MTSIGKALLGFFNSLKLTVALLILSILLIFAATLDQVHLGVWGVQEKYFRSFFIFTQIRGTGLSLPIFPGGYLLGALLLPNLLVAHFCRFRLSWRKSGIWMTHLGLILLLVGQGLSGILQRDNQMRIDVGQTRRYTESFRETELALIDVTDPDHDRVVAIPMARLEGKDPIRHAFLPFAIRPVAYYPNAQLRPRAQMPSPLPSLATAGLGPDVAVEPTPITYKADDTNFPTAYIEILGKDGSLGTFLVSTMIVERQVLTYEGRTWHMILRPERDYLPFSLTLLKFTHDIYPGTDIPKDFASTIRLRSDDARDDREIRIFMNNPLRYGGRAFYQAGYANNDRTSVLQVVSNPSWQVPYLSCALIALGLAVEFGIHLFGFFRRRPTGESSKLAASP